MNLIAWRDEFAIGLPDVDHEHRELIAMINALHESLGPDTAVEQIVAALGEIHARIAAHFALEEREMRNLKYVSLAEHKDDHERLLDDILDIMDTVESPRDYAPEALGARLSKWFTGHFRTHDSRLHRWLAGRS
ncbi:MAG TPA: hemerythrin family protein [Steroidobacteraceae bacterium]|nr:hemerythrin family protein [Steroidobacteraceae bacterium]